MRRNPALLAPIAAAAGVTVLGAALGAPLFGGAQGMVIGAVLGGVFAFGLRAVLSRQSLSDRFQERTQALARLALLLLIVSVFYGLAAGASTVALWTSESDWRAFNALHQVQTLAMLAVALAAAPSLFEGIWRLTRGQRKSAARAALVFFGPVIAFLVGDGLTPHLELPWHQLAHTALGLLPMTALHWYALCRWYPEVSIPSLPRGRGRGRASKGPGAGSRHAI
jgi:hypothetical protein